MGTLNDILPGGFKATEVEPQAGKAAALPAGQYDVEISNCEVKETSKKNGVGLKTEYTVISPTQYAGRKIFGFLNLKHENSEAERIGQSQLAALCNAVGIEVLKDSDELFGKVVRVRVKVRPAQGQYEESNDVTAWEPAGAGPVPAAAAAKPAASAPGRQAKPWEKRAA